MKKYIVLFLVAAVFIFAVSVSCQKTSTISLTTAEIQNAAGPTDTPTITPTPDLSACTGFTFTGLLDDMEDGDNANMIPAPCGPGYWYTYDDQDNSGTSFVMPMSDKWAENHSLVSTPFTMTAGGYNGSSFAARITGTVTNAYTYGFVGMGNNFLDAPPGQPKKPVDMSAVTGVTFWEKGDGKQYKCKIASASPLFIDGDSDNMYEFTITSHTAWYQQDILFANLTQEAYWGTSVAKADALAMATAIQWQSLGADVIGTGVTVDLAVDEVTFY